MYFEWQDLDFRKFKPSPGMLAVLIVIISAFLIGFYMYKSRVKKLEAELKPFQEKQAIQEKTNEEVTKNLTVPPAPVGGSKKTPIERQPDLKKIQEDVLKNL